MRMAKKLPGAMATAVGLAMLWHGAGAAEEMPATLEGHTAAVHALAFSPDGTTLASGSADKTVKLWDVATQRARQTLEGHTDAVSSVAYSADGKTLASGSADKSIRLWDAATGKELATLGGHATGIVRLAYSPDGKALASAGGAASGRSALVLWDTASATPRRTLDVEGKIYGLAFTPGDGNVAALNPWIQCWDVTTGEERSPPCKVGAGEMLAFSPDGKSMAMGVAFPARDDDVYMWEIATGQERAHWYPKLWDIASLSFSPNGKRLVAGGSNFDKNGIWIVDLQTGKQVATPKLPKVHAAVFSPDSKTLAIADNGPTIKLLVVPAAE